MQGPRTTATAWANIQGIEAARMIGKGKYSGLRSATCTGKLEVRRSTGRSLLLSSNAALIIRQSAETRSRFDPETPGCP
jgi:hypothetical protein